MMKISLGMNLQPGPWGGGNQFGQALANYLAEHGVTVTFNLQDPALDIILLAEPRLNLKISAYNERHILRYLLRTNKRAVVVHRINECDERKGTNTVNLRLMRANRVADHTVFVSAWLRDLFFQQGISSQSHSVIKNGSVRRIFHPQGYQRWDKQQPLKLVTHHWGANWLKGFDIYARLDELLAHEPYKSRLQFTYIGNLPHNFTFNHATYLSPKHGPELADAIRRHHVYLTASQHEPGGNHQNEGANCGLPLLYRESGCMPEYCHGFGVAFTADNFEQKLQEMMSTYDHWVDKMAAYPHTAEQMCAEYLQLFEELLARRATLINQRQWRRQPWWLVKTLISKGL